MIHTGKDVAKGSINPRVVLWLKYSDLTVESIEREKDADIPRVLREGVHLPWTIVFSQWIQKKWQEWGNSLGYKDYGDALIDGHTDNEFDEWLVKEVKDG
jgi:hypothetical protein